MINNIKEIDYILKKDGGQPGTASYNLVQKQEAERQTARFEERKRQRDEQDRKLKEEK